MLYFEPKGHTYRLDDPVNGPLCISVTTFLGLFKPKFDADFWSYYTALRMLLNKEKKEFSKWLIIKYKYNFNLLELRTTQENKEELEWIGSLNNVSKQELDFQQSLIKVEWKYENDKSKTKGTAFHNMMEEEIKKDAGLVYEGVFAKILEDKHDLSKLHSPDHVVIAAELQMYNREYMISGTADKVFIHPNRKVDIDDWKTNKKIETTGKSKMIGPISHMEDCNANHYYIQLSLYAWMLEQYGYTPNNLKFTHVEVDADFNILDRTEYHTRYLRREVVGMIKYFDENREYMLNKLKNK